MPSMPTEEVSLQADRAERVRAPLKKRLLVGFDMASRLSVRKKILFNIIIFCLPFLFVEVLVRTYFATQVGPRVMFYGTRFSRYQAKFDPKGVFQGKLRRHLEQTSTVASHENVTGNYSKYYPHQILFDKDEFGNMVLVTINSRGFRGKDFELTKKPGVIRVVTLGASSTFGFRNRDVETYPFYMEEMLNEALPNINAQQDRFCGKAIRAFEVINLGIPHLRTEQIYSLFINEALDLEPDFVTFYEGINDAAWLPDTSMEGTKQAIKALPLANKVFRELRYRLLSVALVGTMISKENRDLDIQSFRHGKSEQFIANLQRIYEASRRNNIQLIVASQQATSREGRGQEREDIHGVTYEREQAMLREKVSATGSLKKIEVFFLVHDELMKAERQWATANNIPYADVIGSMDSNRQYLVSWVHLNPAGN